LREDPRVEGSVLRVPELNNSWNFFWQDAVEVAACWHGG